MGKQVHFEWSDDLNQFIIWPNTVPGDVLDTAEPFDLQDKLIEWMNKGYEIVMGIPYNNVNLIVSYDKVA